MYTQLLFHPPINALFTILSSTLYSPHTLFIFHFILCDYEIIMKLSSFQYFSLFIPPSRLRIPP